MGEGHCPSCRCAALAVMNDDDDWRAILAACAESDREVEAVLSACEALLRRGEERD